MSKKTRVGASIAILALASTALSGCGEKREGSGSGEGGQGFDANAKICAALPDKTSENWVLAGSLFEENLKAAGFTPMVQYAGGSNIVADQQSQVSSMVTNGCKVIFIGAKDGKQLTSQLAEAAAAGAKVVAYDRLLENSKDVDLYLAYDNFKVGELQGQALLDGMKAKKPNGPYTIELFAGSPDDANSKVFFDGAMKVLQPEIEKGTVVVGSGQKDFKQGTTEGWKAENAQRRMDTILQSSYGSKTLDGVLSPNDTLARAIITSVKSAGKPVPVVTGQDSEVESVKWIMKGDQYSTINKDTRALVEAAVEVAKAYQKGETPKVTDEKSYNNGVKVVPAQLLAPHIVTKENAASEYANDPKLSALTK